MHGDDKPVERSFGANAVTGWCCRCTVSVTGWVCGYTVTSGRIDRVVKCERDFVVVDTIAAADSITGRSLLPWPRVRTISKTIMIMRMIMRKRLVNVTVITAPIHWQCISLSRRRVGLVGISSTALWNSSTTPALLLEPSVFRGPWNFKPSRRICPFPWNFDVAVKFREIFQKLRTDWWLVRSSAW